MKKTKYIFLLMLCSLTLLSSCTQTVPEAIQNEYYRLDRATVVELSSGWYFYCDYEEVFRTDGTLYDTYCTVDGVNLKYQNLSDFNLSVTNTDTGEVTGYITPAVNAMCMNKAYNTELTEISEYLKSRPTETELNEDELDFSETEGMLFNKSDVVNVYNSAISSPVNTVGKYSYISFTDIRKSVQPGEYYWQVGYMLFTGNIYVINIELVRNGEKFLSDTDPAELTQQQSQLLCEIEKIENSIIGQQSFVPVGYDFAKTIDNVDFNKLLTVLSAIEAENETNKNLTDQY